MNIFMREGVADQSASTVGVNHGLRRASD